MKYISLILAMFIAGCATSPDEIAATYVSPFQYRDYDCEQLAIEQSNIERKVSSLYQQLKAKSDDDAWQMGVGLVLFWPTLFALEGGDSPAASEYAYLKGSYEAIQTVSIQKKCHLEFESDFSKVAASKEEK